MESQMSTTVAVGDDMAKRKRRFHNPAPRGDEAASGGQDALKAEFGRRLQHALTEKGWNQSDLAREATKHMPGKQTFGRDNISNYVRGKQVPGPVRLKAICAALGMKQEDISCPAALSTRSTTQTRRWRSEWSAKAVSH